MAHLSCPEEGRTIAFFLFSPTACSGAGLCEPRVLSEAYFKEERKKTAEENERHSYYLFPLFLCFFFQCEKKHVFAKFGCCPEGAFCTTTQGNPHACTHAWFQGSPNQQPLLPHRVGLGTLHVDQRRKGVGVLLYWAGGIFYYSVHKGARIELRSRQKQQQSFSGGGVFFLAVEGQTGGQRSTVSTGRGSARQGTPHLKPRRRGNPHTRFALCLRELALQGARLRAHEQGNDHAVQTKRLCVRRCVCERVCARVLCSAAYQRR